ncbi:MAG TPA: hypothetical protein VKM72_07075 [Thermoanaerobaculia bacterium]|nr:hypothetical protein [Thermoanaerobaculia bacterium]
MNVACQPHDTASHIIAPCNIAPKLVPVLKMPVASERWRFGNHSATALTQAGKFVASPRPRRNRASAKPRTVVAKEWAIAATLQTSTPIARPLRTPGDRPYGLRDYTVRDLSGYLLGFGHYIYSAGPRVEIERMDVPVRLEKRLAALLQDLAEYKRMSLTSCLEEILLHTCEPLGDGVASPHTRSQLRYIQKLKAKHGIDYDCHASYRFVERA